MRQQQMHNARIVASIAATFISLACGTNYVYSAWAPQFAERLRLSSTESNLIGLAGNLGMYALGVPIGVFVDSRGPRPAVLIGAVLLVIGYLPLHQAYDNGSGSVAVLSFFYCLSGVGGCMAFAAAVKTSALNWPHSRGTATAFPLAAFGLSAFFFSLVGSILFPGDPSDFLMLLAWAPCGLTLLSFFFLNVYPHSPYQPVPGAGHRSSLSGSQTLRRPSSEEPKVHRSGHGAAEPGTSSSSTITTNTRTTTATNNNNPTTPSRSSSPSTVTTTATITNTPTCTNNETAAASPASFVPDSTADSGLPSVPDGHHLAISRDHDDLEAADETSSLMSSASSADDNILLSTSIDRDRSHRVDIRGMKLLRSLDFWQLFSIMGILAGIGLMTINNIGNDAKALWKHYDDTVSDDSLVKHQQLHVSILSICSFLGRLSSGVGSDFLVKNLHASRVWCLVIACVLFFLAQIAALNIINPHFLGLVSGLSGIAYGFLFGVYPSIVAETFGIHGLSQNWGLMTLSPVVSGNIFNIFYGKVYDQHSVLQPTGERICLEGVDCYRGAYWVTLGACLAGMVVTLWAIRHQNAELARENRKAEELEE